MKKTLSLATTLLISSLLFSACSTTTQGPQADVKKADYVYFKKSMPLHKINKQIIKAGEEDGWRMTEFKENALIAEKTEGDGDTKAVTITFGEDYFTLSPENDDLKDAIEDKFGL
jgi:predicted small secreted protein